MCMNGGEKYFPARKSRHFKHNALWTKKTPKRVLSYTFSSAKTWPCHVQTSTCGLCGPSGEVAVAAAGFCLSGGFAGLVGRASPALRHLVFRTSAAPYVRWKFRSRRNPPGGSVAHAGARAPNPEPRRFTIARRLPSPRGLAQGVADDCRRAGHGGSFLAGSLGRT